MNGSLKAYIIRIIAAAIFCAIVKNLIGKSSAVSSIIKNLCGIFLVLTILSPVMNVDFHSITDHFYIFSEEANEYVDTGTQLSESSIRKSIKEHTEAYIVDKAASLKAELTVEVTLSDDEVPAPYSVMLKGRISPYAKSMLTQLISNDLGISKENQTWI